MADVIQTNITTTNWGWVLSGAVLAAFQTGAIPYGVLLLSGAAAISMAVITLLTYLTATRCEICRLQYEIAGNRTSYGGPTPEGQRPCGSKDLTCWLMRMVCSPLGIARLRYIMWVCLILHYGTAFFSGISYALGNGA